MVGIRAGFGFVRGRFEVNVRIRVRDNVGVNFKVRIRIRFGLCFRVRHRAKNRGYC